jgi:hypothetical protein
MTRPIRIRLKRRHRRWVALEKMKRRGRRDQEA